MKLTAQFLLLCSALCSSAFINPDHSHNNTPSYRHELLTLHKDLIDIPSLSGSEADAAIFLQKYLQEKKYAVDLQRIPDRDATRYNVLAWPSGKKHISPRLLVTSHIDVVPPFIPYHLNASSLNSVTKETLISGRGSVDAKASVAAQLTAISELLASDDSILAEDLMLLFVVGEETSGIGMKHFSSREQFAFESAIFGEPTENKLACGHKGITGGIISARGKAGHSGYPQLGKSATETLVRALSKIIDTDLGSSDRYGNTTVNIGMLSGGVALNVIAKEASAKVAIRVATGDQTTGARSVHNKIRKILKETDDELTAEFSLGYGPVKCQCDVDGFDTMVASYGTDVPNLQGKHISYLYGPGSILVAHGDDEGLKVGDLEEAVEGYKSLIKHALSTSKGKREMGDL